MKRRYKISIYALAFIFAVALTELILLFGINSKILFLLLVPPFFFVYKYPKEAFFLGFFIFLGIFRSLFSVHIPTEKDLDFYADSKNKQDISGVVCELPDIRIDRVNLIICTEKGKVFTRLPRFPEYQYGDELSLYGKLEIPSDTKDFSYKNYLAKEGIYSTMYFPVVKKISENQGNVFLSFLFRAKYFSEKNIKNTIPSPESGFANGILFGNRGQMNAEIINDFRVSGLTHLLALSGFNIAILISFVFFVLQIFPKRFALFITLLVLIGFILMVGASASIVRAGIMGALSLFALHSGRKTQSIYTLILVSGLMILWNPKILLYDISFQLSVAGVLGIALFSPLFKTNKIPNFLALRDAGIITISAQIAVSPLLIFHFNQLSLISPITNILIAPLIPLAMLLSFLSIFLGKIAGFLAYIILKIGILIAVMGAKIPYAQIEVSPYFSVPTLLIFISILLYAKRREIINYYRRL